MEKLEKLQAEKFRILKDPELKGIVGKANGCEGSGTNCGGSCFYDSYTTGNGVWWGGGIYPVSQPGTCYYSSIARECVCG